MASFLKYGDRTKITIPKVEDKDKFVVYEIHVEMGDVKWTVTHRYNDFVQLHEVLVSGHSVARDILPPKKVIGNKEPAFLEKRRDGLETYLSTVFRFLQKSMPRELAKFLDFQLYDVLYLVQNLAEQFFHEELFYCKRSFRLTPLELHAICERMKQPCPSFGYLDQKEDFGHVLDYCYGLEELRVQGSQNYYKNSNILPNQLPFDFNVFKSLEKLTLSGVNCDMITDFGELRNTLKTFEVHNSNLIYLSDLLMCDQVHKEEIIPDGPHVFHGVTNADFSFNDLKGIDNSIQLLPNVEYLNLEGNKIDRIQFLQSLIKLKHLNLSTNCFTDPQNLELKLCKIVNLDLSQNHLTSLKAFSKLYSLESLNLRSNRIVDVSEVKHISQLPCLENLILTGNLVSVIVDYRVKVFELFGSRAPELCLDNEKPNQKELDKVAILQAIKVAKEGKICMSKGKNFQF